MVNLTSLSSHNLVASLELHTFFVIPPTDGFRRDVCHGPITPYEVNKVLNRLDNKKTGNYLIRESRNVTKAYTLSLCAIGQIFNYRVICSSDGEYCFEGPEGDNGSNGHSMFSTMKDLIEHYSLMQVCK